MKEYYVNRKTENPNYGIYDYFMSTKDRDWIKTIGCMDIENYIFHVDIYDHRGEINELTKLIDKDCLWVTADQKIHNKCELHIYYSLDEDNKMIPSKLYEFEYKTILGILYECKKYYDETCIKINVSISERLFKDNMDRTTYDIDELIEDFKNNHIDITFKEDFDISNLFKEMHDEIENTVKCR